MITKEFVGFFKDLSRNNNKDWFDANKKRYEQFVKKPFAELTAQVISGMKKVEKGLTAEPKDAIFRINRDIRFSQDKSPYKLHMAALVSPGGKKDHLNPGLYYQLSAEGIWLGCGVYMPDKSALENIREHIASNLSRFEKLLKDKDFVKYFSGEIQGEKNKVIPAGLKEAAVKQPYIYNKQFYYGAEYKDSKKMLDSNLADFLVRHYVAAQPMNNFLRDALKK